MSERADSLTGVWQGLYTYPSINKSVSFMATLIETPGALSGSTNEPRAFRDGGGGTLFATLFGSRQGRSVVFRKTYDGAGPNYNTVELRWDVECRRRRNHGPLGDSARVVGDVPDDSRDRQGDGAQPQGVAARLADLVHTLTAQHSPT